MSYVLHTFYAIKIFWGCSRNLEDKKEGGSESNEIDATWFLFFLELLGKNRQNGRNWSLHLDSFSSLNYRKIRRGFNALYWWPSYSTAVRQKKRKTLPFYWSNKKSSIWICLLTFPKLLVLVSTLLGETKTIVTCLGY